MCYLVRQQQAEAAGGVTAPASDTPGLRPRWIGAAAATLVGGLALATVFVAPLPERQEAAAAVTPTPVAAQPVVPVVEQGKVALDDGVPTAPDVIKVGNCHHGL
jgi:hypothetical protein